ncbi:MAG: AAA family ATPase [Methylocystis sp.]
MRLLSIKISHFKNILESGDVKIQPDVTCIVGKNESGKTAFLQALHRFRPAQANASFNAQRQYPAWLEKQHRRDRDLDAQCPVSVVFKLEPEDIAFIEKRFGVGAFHSDELQISRTYGNNFCWSPKINEPIVIAHIVQGIALGEVATPTTLEELDTHIKGLRAYVDDEESKTNAARTTAEKLTASRTKALGEEQSINDALWNVLLPRIPKFFYFDEYSQLPGRAKIPSSSPKKIKTSRRQNSLRVHFWS